MKSKGRNIILATLCWVLYSIPAHAQDFGLIAFVNDPANGATPLQVSAANAIQPMCITLGGLQGLSAEAADLSLRCTELVHSGFALTGTPGLGRDLGITAPELMAAVQQVTGEELFGVGTLSARVSNGQFANIAGRLNALRLGSANTAVGGRLAYSDPLNDERSLPGQAHVTLGEHSMTGGAASADIAGSRVGWFLEGSFSTGDRDQSAAEDGFDFDSTSFTLGLDYLLDSGVIGVSIGIDNYDADFDNAILVSGGGIEVEGTSGSVFGAYNFGNIFVNGLLSFGNLDSDTSRNAIYASNNMCAPACPGENDTLVGSTEGDFLAGGATAGIDFNRGNWDISTTVSLAYRGIDIDGYSETDPAGGGLALSYAGQTIDSFRSILALGFTGTFSRDFGVLSPHFQVEWHHEFEDKPLPLVAKYAAEDTLTGVPGAAGPGVFSLNAAECISCFQINSDKIDTDFALLSVGLSAVFSRRVQVYGVYDVLLGINDISSNSFSVGLRGQF